MNIYMGSNWYVFTEDRSFCSCRGPREVLFLPRVSGGLPAEEAAAGAAAERNLGDEGAPQGNRQGNRIAL